MFERTAFLCALGLLGLPAFGEESKPARVYTNEDLDKVAPRRGETGVLSRPGTTSGRGTADREPSERAARTTKGEDYWRHQASRTKSQIQALREQAGRIKAQIEREAERASSRKGGRRGGRLAWAAEDDRARRLRDLETRARELESDLEDRARRAGAPPGWLR
jgi:hypothetical protein